MARLNVVHMKGVLPADPLIYKSEERQGAKFNIVVVRDKRKVENGTRTNMVMDRPTILTADAKLIPYIEGLKKNDIIYVKGALSTRKTIKTAICPECGETNHASGVLTYITPISIEKTGSVNDKDEATAYLSMVRATSNEINLLGMLTRDPKKVTPKSGLTITQYQIAINRNYIVPEDPPELRADYPWVKSYGEHAEEDRFRLMEGSIVIIDGFLQSRIVKKHMECEYCGEKYDREDRTTEIVPYDTEYVKKFRSDEEVEEEKKRRMEQAWKDVLAQEDKITEEDVAAGMDDFSEL